MSRTRYFWQKWECQTCQTVNFGSRSDVEMCTSCGSPRKVMYIAFNPRTARIATDPKDIAFLSKRQARWKCSHCGAFPAGHLSECPNCGNAKDSTDKTVKKYVWNEDSLPQHLPDKPIEFEESSLGDIVSKNRDQKYTFDDIEYDYQSSYRSVFDTDPRKSKEKTSLPNKAPYFISTIILVLIFGIGLWFKGELDERYTEVVSIDSVSWSRDINIEQYRWVDETSLTGFPTGYRNGDVRWEQIDTERIEKSRQVNYTESEPDGESCSYYDDGNGGVRESCTTRYRSVTRCCRTETYYVYEPVYGNRYYYEIQRWRHSRTIHAGDSNWDPHWNEDFILLTGEEYERESSRVQLYCVTFTFANDKIKNQCTESENEWRTYAEGFRVTYNGFNWIIGDPVPLID